MLRDLYVVVTSTQRQMVLELSEELGINIHDTEEEERSSMILPDVSKGPIRFYIPHGEWSIARDGALYKGRPVHIEEETGLYYVNVSKSLSTDMLDAVTSPLNIGIGDNFGKPKSDKRKALEAMLTSEEMLALQWALIDIRAATTDEYIKKRVLKIYELLGVQTS